MRDRVEIKDRKRRTKTKEVLTFENKKIGALFYAFAIAGGVCYLLFIMPFRLVMDEMSHFDLLNMLRRNRNGYLSFYFGAFPFLMSMFFIVACGVLKSIDNELKKMK